MIARYSDHASNERTYLAWIRTAIAIMAFGFLIERFNIFIFYVGKTMKDEQHFSSSISVEVIGLSLFLIGIIIIIATTKRYFIHKEFIELEDDVSYNVKKINLLLSALLTFVALSLFVYMITQVLH